MYTMYTLYMHCGPGARPDFHQRPSLRRLGRRRFLYPPGVDPPPLCWWLVLFVLFVLFVWLQFVTVICSFHSLNCLNCSVWASKSIGISCINIPSPWIPRNLLLPALGMSCINIPSSSIPAQTTKTRSLTEILAKSTPTIYSEYIKYTTNLSNIQ